MKRQGSHVVESALEFGLLLLERKRAARQTILRLFETPRQAVQRSTRQPGKRLE